MEGADDARSPSPAAAAAGGSAAANTKSPNTIDLKLLSPSSEVPANGLFFENLPLSTTLGELRMKITNALPSHPPPARQRLIYFGRVLQRDDDTLAGVFGENNINQQRQHTLHLVLPLREAGSQTPNSSNSAAPSPIPGPRASIYPPSSIPRPSSVPPRGTGAASPFRAAYLPPSQLPTPHTAAPASANTTPSRASLGHQTSQPQLRPQALNPSLGDQAHAQQQRQGFDIRSVIGNANIRANITANGQPINLPPEVVNQLLNQHFLRNGGLPDLIANAAAQQQARAQGTEQSTATSTGATEQGGQAATTDRQGHTAGRQPSGQQLFQQFMASVNEASGRATPVSSEGRALHREREGQEERGRSQHQQPTSEDAPDPPEETPIPSVGDSPRRHQQPTSAPSEAQSAHAHQNGPRVHEQSGVNPDGSRWTIRTTSNMENPLNLAAQRGLPQLPQQMQGIPMMPFPQAFPQGFPFPQLQPQPGMPIPIANLRPQVIGTPRSASPARSVSEQGPGPRRVGTPAADLQHRLLHTNQEIHNLNQLIGVLATGTTASGQAAPPISPEQMAMIRQMAESMNGHIEGFGNDLNALAMAHPQVRVQPEFAGLNAMFQAVQGAGRGVRERIETLAPPAQSPSQSEATDGSTSVQPSATQTTSNVAQRASPQPSLATPSTTSDTLSPSLITRETSPTEQNPTTSNITIGPSALPTTQPTATIPSVPELHLLSDPTNTQHYLLVGPNGLSTMGQLPLDVLYPLLATQLPHDQLVRDFNRATREMVHALQRADFRTALHGGLAVPPFLGSGNATASSATGTGEDAARNASTASAATVTAGQRAPAPAAQGIANAAAHPAHPHLPAQGNNAAPAAPHQGDVAAPNANDPRDVLAPIVRNLWLLVRLCIFGWFFFSSGRGYGRLLLLVSLAAVVWCINAGLFGRRVEGFLQGLRDHFGEVVEEAQQGRNAPGGRGVGTPEEFARRLAVRRAGEQRRRVWEGLRRVERTLALAVASLWPGVGEAVVRNVERRRREEEAAAAAEAQRRQTEEEEARKKEADAEAAKMNGNAEGSLSADVGNSGGVERVNKGKEKAVEAEGDVD